jgi:hypothetical protein
MLAPPSSSCWQPHDWSTWGSTETQRWSVSSILTKHKWLCGWPKHTMLCNKANTPRSTSEQYQVWDRHPTACRLQHKL